MTPRDWGAEQRALRSEFLKELAETDYPHLSRVGGGTARSVCWHEAGHIVVGDDLGFQLKGFRIGPTYGHVEAIVPHGATLDHAGAFLMSGAIAELVGKCEGFGIGRDLEEIDRLADRHGYTRESVRRRGAYIAADILLRRGDDLRRIAADLMVGKEEVTL